MADVPDRDLCAGRASAGRRSRLAGFVAGERPGLLATSLLLLVVTGAAWLLLVREPMQQALRLILGNPSFDLRRVTGAFFGLLLLMWPLDTLLLYLLGRAWGLTAPWGRLFLGIGKATAVQAGSIVAWALLATVPATLGSPRLAAASFPLWFLSVGSTRWATYPPAIKGAYGARARPKLWTLLAVVFEVLLVLLAGWAVVTLSGAISGTFLWLLHSPLAGLPRGWPRRLVGGLAGTLIAATASALVSALLCARMAALAARLVPAAAVAAGVAIQLVVWLPWLPV